jgi:UDP-N-acetylglucosamine 2-epimerase
MPEEINRIVADHVAELLLVPTAHAARQLANEGITRGVRVVGDLMVDLALQCATQLSPAPPILRRLGVASKTYCVATIHRAANTDDGSTFARLIEGLRRVDRPMVFPVHPRTRAVAASQGAGAGDNIILCDPLPYADMLALVLHAQTVFTDSGGLQKEAFVLKVPCVTLREETEWLDTLEDGWNVLAGSDPEKIARASRRLLPSRQSAPFGDGRAAEHIVDALLECAAPCAA